MSAVPQKKQPASRAKESAAETKSHSDSEKKVRDALNDAAMEGWSTRGADPAFMEKIQPVVDFALDKYFRVDYLGWERIPEGPCLLIGIHSGTWLTMDAWSLVFGWYRHFGPSRPMHGTAHDVLMTMPVIGPFFRKIGVLPAKRETVTAALAAGNSVVVWPGGEVDALRSWKKRNEVLFAGRRGFVKQAILSGVPIVPVATVGGPDTVFVLSEGKALAKLLRWDKYLRSERMPIVAGLPFGIWPELFPSHIPLPSKIVNEFLEPIHVRHGAAAAKDDDYVNSVYAQVEKAVQDGVKRLAKKRRLPIIG
ncbi:MAG: lysophospholipid acyltransferase family protein [Panacagrimonas sp.]